MIYRVTKLVYRSLHGRVIPIALHDGHLHPSDKDMKEQAIAPHLAAYDVPVEHAGLPLAALVALYPAPQVAP